MQNIILASTSTLHNQSYLEYLKLELIKLYKDVEEILFIPFARPSGISHEAYTQKAAQYFSTIGKRIKGLHEYKDPIEGIQKADAFFTGGGNTFLLVKQLHDNRLMELLKAEVSNGKPYLGCSAGSNIGGINMQTTNDMPIVYPSSFETLGLVPFNINPHYLDPIENNTHMGETRETRIKEFHTQNTIPVIGLREGSWIRKVNDTITLRGAYTARIFKPNSEPYELSPTNKIEL